MNIGMKLGEFKAEWLSHFAGKYSKYSCTGKYIWHIFSFELIDSSEYLSGEDARRAFDKVKKKDALCILPFKRKATVEALESYNITAKQLDEEIEIYVVAKDLSWTYIKTHEDDMCGPYFYSKKL